MKTPIHPDTKWIDFDVAHALVNYVVRDLSLDPVDLDTKSVRTMLCEMERHGGSVLTSELCQFIQSYPGRAKMGGIHRSDFLCTLIRKASVKYRHK